MFAREFDEVDMKRKLDLTNALLRSSKSDLRKFMASMDHLNVRIPKRQNRPKGETPLMLVAERGDVGIFNLVTRACNMLDAKNSCGRTALHYAIVNNHSKIVKVILDLGVDPDEPYGDGEFPLRDAATQELAISRLLISYGANVNRSNRMGSRAIHIACYHGRIDLGKLLVSNGAELNFSSKKKFGPLACAIQNKHSKMVDWLLMNGADPRRQTEALGVAAFFGSLTIAKKLVDNHAPIDALTYKGRSPLSHAKEQGFKAVAAFLEKRLNK